MPVEINKSAIPMTADGFRKLLCLCLEDIKCHVNELDKEEFKSHITKASINLFLHSVNAVLMNKESFLANEKLFSSLDTKEKCLATYKELLKKNQSKNENK